MSTETRRTDEQRYPTLYEAIFGSLSMYTWPMGPQMAAEIAANIAEAWTDKRMSVCACGSYVVLCRHRQPWKPVSATPENTESRDA